MKTVHVEVWWWAEKLSGRVWQRVCRDGVSCWLDWLPAFTYRRRKAAERRQHPEFFTPETPR
jgi:hypothetical protein